MSLFSQAWEAPIETLQAVAGQAVTIDGQQITAVVQTVESTDYRQPGVKVDDNQTSVFISPDDFTSLGGSSLKGKIVVVDGDRMRVSRINRMGGAGAELVCTKTEERNRPPVI